MANQICSASQAFQSNPQLPACFDSRTAADISFLELDQRISTGVEALRRAGVQRGERVGLLAKNSIDYLSALFALHRLGASGLLLNLQLHPEDWRCQLSLAGCRLLLLESDAAERIGRPEQEMLLLSELAAGTAPAAAGSSEAAAAWAGDAGREGAVLFTSSTTGHTKGVRLSIGNFLASAEASNRVTELAPGDTWAVSLPLFHVGGLGIVYRTLLAGARSYLLPEFSTERIAALMEQRELTHLSLIPTMLQSLIERFESRPGGIERGFGGVKAIILAGAPSSPQLLEAILRFQLPVLSAWGMTETTAHCTCMSLEDPPERGATVGRPFHHTEIRIVDEQGKKLPAGAAGEVFVRGPTVCMGYLETSFQTVPSADGWLHTGDLGMFDKEGYLTIVGRKDDMFISGGENIHIGEIEAAASRYPGIQSCAVVAALHPKWGRRPVLFVECRDEASFDPDSMLDFLRERLAKIKLPDRIIRIPRIPRTAIGKTDYKTLELSFSADGAGE